MSTHDDEVAELKVTCQTSCFAGNPLHETPITSEDVGVIVNEVEAIPVVNSCQVRLSDSETNGVGEPLAKGSSSHLNAYRVI